MQQNLVDVKNLTVEFTTRNGVVRAVHDVSFSLAKGETLGIVGESGSGKSVTTYALMRILDENGAIVDGEMSYAGVDLRRARRQDMRDIRGREISMIFQNPRSALNPIRKIGQQIEDVMRQHGLVRAGQAKTRAIELLELVRIADAAQRYHAYPHELSGGMCQRVVIAIAIACQPKLLIADEPTTGLDVTTQKAVLELVTELTAEREMSTVLITHDLGLAAAYCDRIVVMEKGKVVEEARVSEMFANPRHDYTQKLIRATPRSGGTIRDLLPDTETEAAPAAASLSKEPPIDDPHAKRPLLNVTNLTKDFAVPARGGWLRKRLSLKTRNRAEAIPLRAVENFSLKLMPGECVGLVGESGCGKSTTSSMIMRLLDPSAGRIEFDGVDIGLIPAKTFARSSHRAKLQMVFQDPTDCLNPRYTARRSIADPILRLENAMPRHALDQKVDNLADQVGLERSLLDRFPHQLSGGQKARVGIARAIALDPKLLILDEPTAALDVSVQAVVLNLLLDLKAQRGMSYLFVSHDLNVVRLLCDRVIVMRRGAIEEEGDTETVMRNPQSSYTRVLMDAIPHPPERIT